MFQHNTGDRVKDRVSGLAGIVVSRAEHLYGCNRYWVQPEEAKDGKPLEGGWFDEASLQLIKKAAIVPVRYRVVDETEEPAQPLRRAGGPTNQPRSVTGPGTR